MYTAEAARVGTSTIRLPMEFSSKLALKCKLVNSRLAPTVPPKKPCPQVLDDLSVPQSRSGAEEGGPQQNGQIGQGDQPAPRRTVRAE